MEQWEIMKEYIVTEEWEILMVQHRIIMREWHYEVTVGAGME